MHEEAFICDFPHAMLPGMRVTHSRSSDIHWRFPSMPQGEEYIIHH